MQIISIVNQKGGVGKTTTCLNLGAGLAEKGFKTLLIDLDPQANLTQSLLFEKPEGNIYHLLHKDKKIENCIGKVKNELYIIPSLKELSYLQPELLQDMTGNLRLKEALYNLEGFDYVLIDNSPALSNFTYNSLATSNMAIICLQADSIFSLTGLDLVIETIQKTQDNLNKNLTNFKILLNYYNKRKIITKDIEKSLKDTFKNNILKTTIRQCLALSESQAQQQDIFTYAKNSNGAKDFSNLTKEIIKEVAK